MQREATPSVRLGEPVGGAVRPGQPRTPPRARGWCATPGSPRPGRREPRHRLDLPAGQRRRLVTTLRPTRRGDRRVTARHRAQRSARSGWPPGSASLPAPGRVRVLPPFTSRKHLPSKLARLRELDGRTALRVRGQGTEFDSLRDYVIGDDVRSIDWRATARRQQVVVRTWRPERDRRVLIVLDTSRTSAARVGDAPRLDAAMDAALLLAALASRAGDRVDLLAMDRRVRARVEGASRHRAAARAGRGDGPAGAPIWSRPTGPAIVGRDPAAADAAGAGRAADPAGAGRRRGGAAARRPPADQPPPGGARLGRPTPQVSAMAAGPRRRATPSTAPRPPSAAILDRTATSGRADPSRGRRGRRRCRTTCRPQLADRYLALKAAGRL